MTRYTFLGSDALHPQIAGLIWLGIAGFLFIATLYCALEGYLYLTGQRPITMYVRNWDAGHLLIVFMVVGTLIFLLGMGVTHFVVDGPSNTLAATGAPRESKTT